MNSTEREFCDNLSILSDFKPSRYLVAFSGGSDSLALLVLCANVFGSDRTIPVYVNHNLRSEKELNKEIELNILNCRKLGLSLIIREINRDKIVEYAKKTGTEAAARKIRYEILEEERVKNKCDYILTAHHKEDQVETVLMKIIKGSPTTGMRGISEKWGKTLRPLLEFNKKELKKYIEEKCMVASFDSTNNDNTIERNKIRNEIIPQLEKVMPDYQTRLLNIRNAAVRLCSDIGFLGDSIETERFNCFNDAQKAMALYEIWDRCIGTSLPQTLIGRVTRACSLNKQEKIAANGGIFCTYNGCLYLVNSRDYITASSFRKEFNFIENKILLPFGLVLEKSDLKDTSILSLNPDSFCGKVVLRFPVEGESIVLKGGKKTVNKLLQDMKVPSVFRPMVPVLADDEGLCAVFGSCFGGKDRICAKLRTSLVGNKHYKYICYKGY